MISTEKTLLKRQVSQLVNLLYVNNSELNEILMGYCNVQTDPQPIRKKTFNDLLENYDPKKLAENPTSITFQSAIEFLEKFNCLGKEQSKILLYYFNEAKIIMIAILEVFSLTKNISEFYENVKAFLKNEFLLNRRDSILVINILNRPLMKKLE